MWNLKPETNTLVLSSFPLLDAYNQLFIPFKMRPLLHAKCYYYAVSILNSHPQFNGFYRAIKKIQKFSFFSGYSIDVAVFSVKIPFC